MWKHFCISRCSVTDCKEDVTCHVVCVCSFLCVCVWLYEVWNDVACQRLIGREQEKDYRGTIWHFSFSLPLRLCLFRPLFVAQWYNWIGSPTSIFSSALVSPSRRKMDSLSHLERESSQPKASFLAIGLSVSAIKSVPVSKSTGLLGIYTHTETHTFIHHPFSGCLCDGGLFVKILD